MHAFGDSKKCIQISQLQLRLLRFMKKILVLGDIHANFPALQAIWNFVRKYRFDRIVNTGDLTVYSTFPNETIQWFRKRTESVSILGNTDRRILRILNGKKLKRPKKKEKRVMYYWTSENLLPENVQYLRSLPRQTDLTIGNIRIGVFHGTCDDEDETLFPSAPESRFRELARTLPFRFISWVILIRPFISLSTGHISSIRAVWDGCSTEIREPPLQFLRSLQGK